MVVAVPRARAIQADQELIGCRSLAQPLPHHRSSHTVHRPAQRSTGPVSTCAQAGHDRVRRFPTGTPRSGSRRRVGRRLGTQRRMRCHRCLLQATYPPGPVRPPNPRFVHTARQLDGTRGSSPAVGGGWLPRRERKRRSSARTSASWPPTRSRDRRSDGSSLVHSTSVKTLWCERDELLDASVDR